MELFPTISIISESNSRPPCSPTSPIVDTESRPSETPRYRLQSHVGFGGCWDRAPKKALISEDTGRRNSINKANTEVLYSIKMIRSSLKTINTKLGEECITAVDSELTSIQASLTRISRAVIDLEGCEGGKEISAMVGLRSRQPSRKPSFAPRRKTVKRQTIGLHSLSNDSSKSYIMSVTLHGMLEAMTKLFQSNRGTVYLFRGDDHSPSDDNRLTPKDIIISVADICSTRTVPLQKGSNLVRHVFDSGIMLTVNDNNRNSCIVPLRKCFKEDSVQVNNSSNPSNLLGVVEISDKTSFFTSRDESLLGELSTILSQLVEGYLSNTNARTSEIRSHGKTVQDIFAKNRCQSKPIPLKMDPLKVYRIHANCSKSALLPTTEKDSSSVQSVAVEESPSLREISLYMQRVEQCWKNTRDKVIELETKIERIKSARGREEIRLPSTTIDMNGSQSIRSNVTLAQVGDSNIKKVIEKSSNYPSTKPLPEKHKYQIRCLLKLHSSSQETLLNTQQYEVQDLLSLQTDEIAAPSPAKNYVPPWVRALKTVLTDRDTAYFRNKICVAADISPFWNPAPPDAPSPQKAGRCRLTDS